MDAVNDEVCDVARAAGAAAQREVFLPWGQEQEEEEVKDKIEASLAGRKDNFEAEEMVEK